MNEQENYNYETALDALLDCIRWLPKPTVKLLNIPKYRKMMETAVALQMLLGETADEGCISIEIDQDFYLGTISVELSELSIQNPQRFSQIISNADNFEIYPLSNGKLRLDITLQNILKGYYERGNS